MRTLWLFNNRRCEKGKYVYFSCNNTKCICKKVWVEEKIIVVEILKYFDKISLSDKQISDAIAY